MNPQQPAPTRPEDFDDKYISLLVASGSGEDLLTAAAYLIAMVGYRLAPGRPGIRALSVAFEEVLARWHSGLSNPMDPNSEPITGLGAAFGLKDHRKPPSTKKHVVKRHGSLWVTREVMYVTEIARLTHEGYKVHEAIAELRRRPDTIHGDSSISDSWQWWLRRKRRFDGA